MSSGSNLLETAASSYLRSARHQPVKWHPWGEAAFARAQAEDKPILLDIGAVWCHWCHVMDRESYEDPEVAAVINEHFVAVKVDRDERPDVDARYQAAVSAITRAGRLAADRVSDSGWAALLWRHVYSARRSLRAAGHRAGAAGHGAGVARAARRGAGDGGQRDGCHRAQRELFRRRRRADAGAGGQDCRVGAEQVRSAQWRIRLAAQVSSPGGA